MNKIIITIETVNAAFEDAGINFELARILKELANNPEKLFDGKKIFDLNGNAVGKITIEE